MRNPANPRDVLGHGRMHHGVIEPLKPRRTRWRSSARSSSSDYGRGVGPPAGRPPALGDGTSRPGSHQAGFPRLRPASSVCMVLKVIADDDGLVKNFSGDRADVLVSCGDLGDQTILTVAQAVVCRRVFAVKGNHDGGGPFPAPITDLHLRIEEFDGLRFGGFNGSWRYKPRGHFLYEQDEAERQLAAFPPVDVFVAHNSPR